MILWIFAKFSGSCFHIQISLGAVNPAKAIFASLKPEIVALTGLSGKVKVVAGAGDNAAAAVGTGTVGGGPSAADFGTLYDNPGLPRRLQGIPQAENHLLDKKKSLMKGVISMSGRKKIL